MADATAAPTAAKPATDGRPVPRPAKPLRGTLSGEAAFLWGAAAIGVVLAVWYLVTAPLFVAGLLAPTATLAWVLVLLSWLPERFRLPLVPEA